MTAHVPVMLAEALAFLRPEGGGVFVDCTVGAGGHTRALLEAGASRVIAFDRDQDALAHARGTLAAHEGRVDFVHTDYRDINSALDAVGVAQIDGALADFGISSMQLSAEGRGFSFQRDEPLDMRLDRSTGPTAADLIEQSTESELADAIYAYGEERFSRRIARAIVAARDDESITTTGRLATIVRRAVPRRHTDRIDPATRTFQALRIWVNRELEGLDQFVRTALTRLRTGGRLVIITFHSLEDRIVKHTLRALAMAGEPAVKILTKKPLVPTDDEVRVNPRARSAKLRAAERLA